MRARGGGIKRVEREFFLLFCLARLFELKLGCTPGQHARTHASRPEAAADQAFCTMQTAKQEREQIGFTANSLTQLPGLPPVPQAQQTVTPSAAADEAARPKSTAFEEPSGAHLTTSAAASGTSATSGANWLCVPSWGSFMNSRKAWQAAVDRGIENSRDRAANRRATIASGQLLSYQQYTSLIDSTQRQLSGARGSKFIRPATATAGPEGSRSGGTHRAVMWGHRLLATAATKSVMSLLFATVFCIQFLSYATLGPTYQSFSVAVMSDVMTSFWTVQLCFLAVNYERRNIGWLMVPLYFLMLGTSVLLRFDAFGSSSTSVDAYRRSKEWFPGLTIGMSGAILACVYLAWAFDVSVFRPTARLKRVLTLQVLGVVCVLITFRYVVWDRLYMQGDDVPQIVRQLFCQALRSTYKACSFALVERWYDEQKKEDIARSAVVALAPFHVVAVTGCENWTDFGVFLGLDWILCLAHIGAYSFADVYQTKHSSFDGKSGDVIDPPVAKFLLDILAPQAPATWLKVCPRGTGNFVWRRWAVSTELQATSGCSMATMFACAMAINTEAARAYMPAGDLSFAFLALLVASEHFQDLLTWVALVHEAHSEALHCARTPVALA